MMCHYPKKQTQLPITETLAIHCGVGMLYAVKVVKKETLNEKARVALQLERDVMEVCNRPLNGCVRVKGCVTAHINGGC